MVAFPPQVSDAFSLQINLITSYESRAYITINPKSGGHDGGAIWLGEFQRPGPTYVATCTFSQSDHLTHSLPTGFWAEVHYNPLVHAA